MPVLSAGLLLYRVVDPDGSVEVLLGHMGGPYWAKKDAGAWSIPKGEVEPEEEPLAAARRELTEELGVEAPPEPYLELGAFAQSTAKTIQVWAVEADLDPATCTSTTFELEWPPRSGRTIDVPEIDRAASLAPDEARRLGARGRCRCGGGCASRRRCGPSDRGTRRRRPCRRRRGGAPGNGRRGRRPPPRHGRSR
jgi:predicted NUDIX family NTP pyrophosphohydrolase